MTLTRAAHSPKGKKVLYLISMLSQRTRIFLTVILDSDERSFMVSLSAMSRYVRVHSGMEATSCLFFFDRLSITYI